MLKMGVWLCTKLRGPSTIMVQLLVLGSHVYPMDCETDVMNEWLKWRLNNGWGDTGMEHSCTSRGSEAFATN